LLTKEEYKRVSSDARLGIWQDVLAGAYLEGRLFGLVTNECLGTESQDVQLTDLVGRGGVVGDWSADAAPLGDRAPVAGVEGLAEGRAPTRGDCKSAQAQTRAALQTQCAWSRRKPSMEL
jgi:hypothetical protein